MLELGFHVGVDLAQNEEDHLASYRSVVGVKGLSGPSYGVWASSDSGTALYATAASAGKGVYATSSSGVGVHGDSSSSTGVEGSSYTGRGGYFRTAAVFSGALCCVHDDGRMRARFC